MNKLIWISALFTMTAAVHAAKPPTNNSSNASAQAQSHAASNSAVAKNISSSPYPVVSEPVLAAPLPIVVIVPLPIVTPIDPIIVDSAVTQILIDPPEVNPLPETTTTNPQLTQSQVGDVPLPAGVWLFSSAITGLIGFGKRKAVKA